jgi:hypothetical protein
VVAPMVSRRGFAGKRIARGAGALLIPNLIFAALGCILGSVIGGRPGLALASIGSLAAAWSALCIGRKLVPHSISFPILVSVYGAQIAAQLLLTLVDATTLTNHVYTLDLADYSGPLTVSHLSVLAGSIVGAGVLYAIGLKKRRLPVDLTQSPPMQAKVYLVIAFSLCMLQSSVPFLLPNNARWIFLVFTANLDVACFFVGWFAADLHRMAPWCLCALVANCAIGGLMGQRYALVLLGLYVVGRLTSPRERHRRRVIFTALAATGPVLMVFWLVGDVRVGRGRDRIELLSFSNISGFFGAASNSLARNESRGGDFVGDALARLYAWPNAAITILTPDVVPYRGVSEWVSECRSYMTIWGWSDDAVERAFAEGTGSVHSADYGYADTLATSVEFGVIGDGWSTAGPFGVVLVGGLVALFICATEYLAFHGLGFSYAAKLILLCILAKSCILSYAGSGPMVIRTALLNVFFWALVFKMADSLQGGQTERGRLRARRDAMLANQK